jgi:hypothetical protein
MSYIFNLSRLSNTDLEKKIARYRKEATKLKDPIFATKA